MKINCADKSISSKAIKINIIFDLPDVIIMIDSKHIVIVTPITV